MAVGATVGGAVGVAKSGEVKDSFEPGMEALRAIEQASLLVRVGHPHFPFERAWLDELVHDRPDLRTVDATEAANPLATDDDPHLWLSPAANAALAPQQQRERARGAMDGGCGGHALLGPPNRRFRKRTVFITPNDT